MPVSQSAPAALEQDELFAVGGHLSGIFRRTVLEHPSGDRSQRYGNDDVLAVLTRGAGSGTAFAVLRELVTLVLKVDQRPILLSPRRMICPPRPPSPPSGPPNSTNFSRRKCADPLPPCPERANIFT